MLQKRAKAGKKSLQPQALNYNCTVTTQWLLLHYVNIVLTTTVGMYN